MALTPEQKARRARLRAADKRIARFKRHPRWDDVACVLGYVDSNGAVHAVIVLDEDRDKDSSVMHHDHHWPNCHKFFAWRWYTGRGMEKSVMCRISRAETPDEYEAATSWLRKQGVAQ